MQTIRTTSRYNNNNFIILKQTTKSCCSYQPTSISPCFFTPSCGIRDNRSGTHTELVVRMLVAIQRNYTKFGQYKESSKFFEQTSLQFLSSDGSTPQMIGAKSLWFLKMAKKCVGRPVAAESDDQAQTQSKYYQTRSKMEILQIVYSRNF